MKLFFLIALVALAVRVLYLHLLYRTDSSGSCIDSRRIEAHFAQAFEQYIRDEGFVLEPIDYSPKAMGSWQLTVLAPKFNLTFTNDRCQITVDVSARHSGTQRMDLHQLVREQGGILPKRSPMGLKDATELVLKNTHLLDACYA